jgi:hypothetical protein
VSAEAVNRYFKVKEVFQVEFYLPEIDFVRLETGRCYVIAAYHGMITLTNLLLERYRKLILIYKYTGFKSIQDLKNLAEDFKQANKKYSKMSLGETLQECWKELIINEETYNFFFEMKNRFRDGFGHADASKILKACDATMMRKNTIAGYMKITLQIQPLIFHQQLKQST